MDARGRFRERDLDGLRAVLNEWDPIGVRMLHDGPDDEYDCLRWPLLSLLKRGASRCELADFLQRELSEHFGVGGHASDEVLDRVLAWWNSLDASA